MKKNNTPKVTFYVPESLDTDSLPDKVVVLVGIVGNKRLHRNYSPELYNSLSSVRLREVLGSRYKAVVNQAIKSGLIESDGSYQVGFCCKGYRLTDPNCSFKKIAIEGALAEKVIEDRLAHDSPVSYLHRKAAKVNREFTLLREECEQIAWDDSIENGEDEEFVDNDGNVEVISAKSRYESHLEQLYRFGHDHYYKIDSFGRVHTPITSLWGNFRKKLRLDGRRLVHIDVSNSQAYLVCAFLERFCHMNPADIQKAAQRYARAVVRGRNRLDTGVAGSGEVTRANLYNQALTMFTQLAMYCRDNAEAISAIARIARNGQFFEEMMQRTGYKGTRQQFKAAFWKIFFGRGTHLTKQEQAASDAMGELGECLKIMKTIHYAGVPKLFQALEAEIIFDSGMMEALQEEGIRYATIHDSIECLPEHRDFVIKMLRMAYVKAGYDPPTICWEYEDDAGNYTEGTISPDDTSETYNDVKAVKRTMSEVYGIEWQNLYGNEEPKEYLTVSSQWWPRTPTHNERPEPASGTTALYVAHFSVVRYGWPIWSEEYRKSVLLAHLRSSKWSVLPF